MSDAAFSGLAVVNASNPLVPEIVGSVEGGAAGVVVSGAYAYLVGGASGLRV